MTVLTGLGARCKLYDADAAEYEALGIVNRVEYSTVDDVLDVLGLGNWLPHPDYSTLSIICKVDYSPQNASRILYFFSTSTMLHRNIRIANESGVNVEILGTMPVNAHFTFDKKGVLRGEETFLGTNITCTTNFSAAELESDDAGAFTALDVQNLIYDGNEYCELFHDFSFNVDVDPVVVRAGNIRTPAEILHGVIVYGGHIRWSNQSFIDLEQMQSASLQVTIDSEVGAFDIIFSSAVPYHVSLVGDGGATVQERYLEWRAKNANVGINVSYCPRLTLIYGGTPYLYRESPTQKLNWYYDNEYLEGKFYGCWAAGNTVYISNKSTCDPTWPVHLQLSHHTTYPNGYNFEYCQSKPAVYGNTGPTIFSIHVPTPNGSHPMIGQEIMFGIHEIYPENNLYNYFVTSGGGQFYKYPNIMLEASQSRIFLSVYHNNCKRINLSTIVTSSNATEFYVSNMSFYPPNWSKFFVIDHPVTGGSSWGNRSDFSISQMLEYSSGFVFSVLNKSSGSLTLYYLDSVLNTSQWATWVNPYWANYDGATKVQLLSIGDTVHILYCYRGVIEEVGEEYVEANYWYHAKISLGDADWGDSTVVYNNSQGAESGGWPSFAGIVVSNGIIEFITHDFEAAVKRVDYDGTNWSTPVDVINTSCAYAVSVGTPKFMGYEGATVLPISFATGYVDGLGLSGFRIVYNNNIWHYWFTV